MPIDCSPPCTQEPPEENFPEVVLLATFNVRKGHSIKGQIIRKNCQPPKDVVFHMQALQIWKPYPQSTAWHQHYGNILFSLDHVMCTEAQ